MSTSTKQIDTVITTLIAEFLLRQPQSKSLATNFLTNPQIPLSNDNSRLKRTKTLKSIEDEINNASITEIILDSLETIAELDERQGLRLSDSMKSAYCAVAVECAAKYLAAGGDVGKMKYFEIAYRVWRERIGKLEEKGSELVSEELKAVREEIEAAIWNKNVGKRFVERNTRNEALRAVRVYVREAEGVLGPSILESVARIVLREKQGEQSDEIGEKGAINLEIGVVDGNVDAVVDEHSRRGSQPLRLVVSNEKEVMGRQERSGDARDEGSGGNIANPGLAVGKEGRVDDKQIAESDAHMNSTAPKAGSQLRFVMDGKRKGIKNRNVQFGGRAFNPRCHRGPVKIVDSDEQELNSVNGKNDEHTDLKASDKRPLSERHDNNIKAAIEIITIDDMDSDLPSNECNNLSTPEVNKVVDSLKQSRMELREVVQDPLPDALKVSENIIPVIDGRNLSSSCNPLENRSSDEHNVGTNGQPDVHKRSLIERNSTVHTVEGDDSIDGSRETSPIRNIPQLVSPKRGKISPIKNQEQKMFTRRRRINRWTLEEEEALREGVQIHGKGNWKYILKEYWDVFNNRTEVDLKDKWRNLTKWH